MTVVTERFIKGANNVITLTLEENDVAISGAWTALNIHICNPADHLTSVLTITRSSNGNGITLSAGILTINPANLTETLTALIPGKLYPVVIKVTDATTNTTGAYFGDTDSTEQLYFEISDPP